MAARYRRRNAVCLIERLCESTRAACATSATGRRSCCVASGTVAGTDRPHEQMSDTDGPVVGDGPARVVRDFAHVAIRDGEGSGHAAPLGTCRRPHDPPAGLRFARRPALICGARESTLTRGATITLISRSYLLRATTWLPSWRHADALSGSTTAS